MLVVEKVELVFRLHCPVYFKAGFWTNLLYTLHDIIMYTFVIII